MHTLVLSFRWKNLLMRMILMLLKSMVNCDAHKKRPSTEHILKRLKNNRCRDKDTDEEKENLPNASAQSIVERWNDKNNGIENGNEMKLPHWTDGRITNARMKTVNNTKDKKN